MRQWLKSGLRLDSALPLAVCAFGTALSVFWGVWRHHEMEAQAQSDLLRPWAYIDGLTGVHNRRHFDERLATEWDRAARHGKALSVVLLDVDLFKRYNDLYGHQSGDDCLRRVATALKGKLQRPGDLVARYGGEEFVCLLPETPLHGALALAEQLGAAVHALQIEHADSSVATVVTASLGVCSKPEHRSGSATALLGEADAQLYRAKSRGRHQVWGAELAGAAGT